MPELYFDAKKGEALKDAGQLSVLGHADEDGSWRGDIRALAEKLCIGRHRITSDDVRFAAYSAGLDEPPHPNAWGAVFTYLAGKGLIEDTGERVRTKRKDGHRRKITVWRVLL